jgi:hypothetical protein
MGIFETLRDWIPFKKVSNETDVQKLFDANLKASEKYWKAEQARKPDKEIFSTRNVRYRDARIRAMAPMAAQRLARPGATSATKARRNGKVASPKGC